MRYEILGSLRIVDDGGTSYLVRSRKLEAALGTLLIQAGKVVSIDQLTAEIWDAEPPRRATAAVYVYISQLRKLVRRPGSPDDAIITQFPGYLFRLDDDVEIDLHLFERLVREGRTLMSTHQFDQAARRFETALQLYRGPVLGGFHGGPIMTGFATWLEQIWLECIEMIVKARLATGRHQEIVGLLYTQIAEHPLHEIFYQQLMVALYHSGRRAEALKVYQDARDALRSELGLEPCPGLEQVQRSILCNEGWDSRRDVPELAGRM